MTGGHDRRIARLEGALPIPSKTSKDELLMVEIVLGPERASQIRRSGFDDLAADERQMLRVAIESELARRDAAGMTQNDPMMSHRKRLETLEAAIVPAKSARPFCVWGATNDAGGTRLKTDREITAEFRAARASGAMTDLDFAIVVRWRLPATDQLPMERN